jgi:hypothetical protein
VVKCSGVDLEVLSEDFTRDVCKPVSELEGRVFAKVAIVEDLRKRDH